MNRAVAHGRAFGPDDGLAVLDQLDPGALGDAPLLPSVRGGPLERAGRQPEAGRELTEAAKLTRNEGERLVLLRRAELNRSRQ